MLTMIDEGDGERVLTVQIHEATIGAELISAFESVLNNVENGEIENFVLQFSGDPDSVTGEFPSWQPGPVRSDMRYFARWDETLSRISRLKAKTFAAYDGRVGAAAVHVGLVMDLRLASAQARLSLGSLSEGRFPGMGLGLVDVVEDTVEAALDASVKAMRPVTPEAARFTRRILDDCYLLEHSAAAELAKAARYKVGIPNHDD